MKRISSFRWAAIIVLLMLPGTLFLVNRGSEGSGNPVNPPVTKDWPMWGFDALRRAATPMSLDKTLHLHWVRELPAPRPAWTPQPEDADKLQFDLSYSPVVLGRRMFLASMTNDSLTAYDTRTGQQQWRFYADGPLRLAPVARGDKVYATCDDGLLYCLDAENGKERWRFRPSPDDRRVLGNTRLINMWPMRGGPVLRDGKLYFAASIWPLMGTFIGALDADTGRLLWCNSGSGSIYNLHQHGGAEAFGGVAPQGYLAATDERLLVAGGRTVPAAYDRTTGKLLHFVQDSSSVGKGAGGYRLAAQGDWYYNHGQIYRLEDGRQLRPLDLGVIKDRRYCDEKTMRDAALRLTEPILTEPAAYYVINNELHAFSPDFIFRTIEVEDQKGETKTQEHFLCRRLWQATFDIRIDRLHLLADRRLYGSGPDGTILAIELPHAEQPARLVWQAKIEGDVYEMIAADDRLFVVTTQGCVYCFGPGETETQRHTESSQKLLATAGDDGWSERAREIIEATANEGYALLLGVGSGRLLEELLAQSELHVIAVDPDPERVDALRRRLDAAGLYGTRTAVHVGDALTFPFPPYLAGLIVSEDLESAGLREGPQFISKLFHPLRPYGGTAWLPLPPARHQEVAEWIRDAGLHGAELKPSGQDLRLVRTGPLEGAGQWTHQYADSANTSFSPDQIARPPLGVLWFGGPPNTNILPRHGQGPVPQVIQGRVILPGVETMSARDVYTGRELWVRAFPGIGHPFTNLELEEKFRQGTAVYMTNLPGANYIGSFYASADDGIYVRYRGRIVRLNPADGEILDEFAVPFLPENNASVDYGHISVWKDLLILTVEPQIFDDEPIGEINWNATSSNRLVVMDRYSGRVLWSRAARIGFRHNTIITAAEKVFVIDGLSEKAIELLKRRGEAPEKKAVLLALDARGGREQWTSNRDVFGTWLGYSAEYDILLEAGRRGGKRDLPDEPNNRMRAHRGADGSLLWDRSSKYAGPLALHGQHIIPGKPGEAFDLLTGQDRVRLHPLTGKEIPWRYIRTYGCGTLISSTHLLTFRSGAAGFGDPAGLIGTGNLGGFKAGCTNNLIVADGLLNAPDYTRTCTCSYQNQTSLAFIHMPDAELWTFDNIEPPEDRILRIGLNLAAPGNRFADNGTLWLNHPSVGGPSPDVPMTLVPEDRETFRMHASLITGGPDTLPWVAASGMVGLRSLSVRLRPEQDSESVGTYTVRLHFVEPEDTAAGRRVFDVRLQGQSTLAGMDVFKETGGRHKALIKEFHGIRVEDALTIELSPTDDSTLAPILCGVEAVSDENGTMAVSRP